MLLSLSVSQGCLLCLHPQDNGSILALATQKELVELDIGLLLRPPAWLSDDNEFDIETLRK